VEAQRQLVERIAYNCGPEPPQPHFDSIMAANGCRPITAEQYLDLQIILPPFSYLCSMKDSSNVSPEELKIDLAPLENAGENKSGILNERHVIRYI